MPSATAQIFRLGFEALRDATVWPSDRAEAYVALLGRAGLRFGLASLFAIALYAFGAATQAPWILSAATSIFGLLIVGFMVISAPILTGVAAAARAFPSFGLTVNLVGAMALCFLLLAQAFQFIPITPRTVLVVPTCALIVGALWFQAGNKQSLSRIAGKMVSIMAVSIAGSLLQGQFPETWSRLSSLGASLDRVLARIVSSLGVQADSPHRIQLRSLAEFKNQAFFHPTNQSETLVWYSRSADGEIELFSAPGFHPSTGEQLRPITVDIVSEIRTRLEHQARDEAPESVPRPQPGGESPQSNAIQGDEEQAHAKTASAQRKYQDELAELTRTYEDEQRRIQAELRSSQMEALRVSESSPWRQFGAARSRPPRSRPSVKWPRSPSTGDQ